MIYNWLIKHKKNAYGFTIGFLIFTILVYAFQSHWFVRHIYKYIGYWAVPLSAAFMLVLAYMAYISITEGRRIREEERERDFKRRCISDIEEWAEKSIIFLNRPETHLGHTTEWYKSALQPFTVKSKWMMDASRVFDKDDKKALLKTVDKVVTNLEEYRTGKLYEI